MRKNYFDSLFDSKSKIEKVRKQAYDEGYNDGFADGKDFGEKSKSEQILSFIENRESKEVDN